jgi:glycosyltransferase involved in cell wall biosynthesis
VGSARRVNDSAAPLVTVVIPTRDRPQLLARSAGSALAQRGVTCELVIVDDGSQPSLASRPQLASLLGHPRVRVVRNEHAKGVASARNCGIAAARSHWVAFLDDDDLWAADKLSLQLKALERAPAARWSYTGEAILDEDLRFIWGNSGPTADELVDDVLKGNRVPGGGSSVMAARDALLEVGGFDETLSTLADWDLWIRLALRWPAAPVAGTPLVGYVLHSSSMSRDVARSNAEFARVERRYEGERTARDLVVGTHGYLLYLSDLERRDNRRARAAWLSARAARAGRDPKALAFALATLLWPGFGKARDAYNRSMYPVALRTAAEAWVAAAVEPSSAGRGPDHPRPLPSVAIIPWGNVIEDYLDGIGRDVDDFTGAMGGGWLFGYVEALQDAGWRPVLICVSVAVDRPERRQHPATGAPVWVLPATRSYRWLRTWLDQPYGWSWQEAVRGRRSPLAKVPQLLGWMVAPYTGTPVRATLKVLRDEECAAAMCQEYEDGRFDILTRCCWALGIAVFATYQGGDHTRTPIERLLRKGSVRRSAGLIIGSLPEARRVRRAHAASSDQVHVVANPLDVPPPVCSDERGRARENLGLSVDGTVVVWHGRVDIFTKGLDILLAAWKRCCDERPDADLALLMIGTGPGAPELHRRIAEEHVERLQWRDEFVLDRAVVRRYLAAADVFAFPSRHEGFAVAPMEAMAAGLPVVAADASGVAELLSEGAGIVVPLDDPEAFASALGCLIDDPRMARETGARGREMIAGRFSSRAVGRQLAAALDQGTHRV